MIEIKNLHKAYNETTVLKDINLVIPDGEIYGLVGRSGAGKSTLLRCINGLESYDSGSLTVNGFDIKQHSEKEIREFRKKIGMIFQHFSLMERKSVYQNIALPMKCWGYDKTVIDKKVRELLKIVELEDKIDYKPRALSGGQKQRVAIARALTLDPDILLCDEATSALDPKTTQAILSLLKRINETLHIGIIIVTHQMGVVKKVCHEISILENGEISASGSVSDIFLKQPKSLRNLLGENDDDIWVGHGTVIRITYKENDENSHILSDLVRELNVDFSLSDANLDRYRDTVLGSLAITVEKADLEKICNYLTERAVHWEVLTND